MKQVIDDITNFMAKAGQLPFASLQPTPEVRKLRAKLIMEEALEQVQALGIEVKCYKVFVREISDFDFNVLPLQIMDLIKTLDGAIDQVYVSMGTVIACGMGSIAFEGWEIVQQANMAKFGPGSWTDPSGKVQKPKGWEAPDKQLGKLIERLQQTEPSFI